MIATLPRAVDPYSRRTKRSPTPNDLLEQYIADRRAHETDAILTMLDPDCVTIESFCTHLSTTRLAEELDCKVLTDNAAYSSGRSMISNLRPIGKWRKGGFTLRGMLGRKASMEPSRAAARRQADLPYQMNVLHEGRLRSGDFYGRLMSKKYKN